MTNEQVVEHVIELVAYKAKAQEEHDMFKSMLQTMRDDIKETKSLAEDLHIMAINIKHMQETLNDTSRKVDTLTSKEFVEYKENKKAVKQQIRSALVGSGITLVLSIIGWVVTQFVMKGGV